MGLSLMLAFLLDTSPLLEPLELDIDDSSVTSFLITVCATASETSTATFRISGFGSEAWPTAVTTELPIFLDQLPAFIVWIADGGPKPFVLEFFEQGMEFDLHLMQSGELVMAEFVGASSWKPAWSTDTTTRQLLREQLLACVHAFLKLLGNNVNVPSVSILLHQWLRPIQTLV